MTRTVMAALAALSLLAAPVLAKEPSAAQQAQQDRMTECNKKAEGMKGDERKAFMSKCLSGDSKASSAQTAQQQKMTDCNKKAAGMKGDERNAFMSKCLSGEKK